MKMTDTEAKVLLAVGQRGAVSSETFGLVPETVASVAAERRALQTLVERGHVKTYDVDNVTTSVFIVNGLSWGTGEKVVNKMYRISDEGLAALKAHGAVDDDDAAQIAKSIKSNSQLDDDY